jgi:hypothetical protein
MATAFYLLNQPREFSEKRYALDHRVLKIIPVRVNEGKITLLLAD